MLSNARHHVVAVGAALLAALALVLRAVSDADWLYAVALALLAVAAIASTLGPWGRKAWVPVGAVGGIVLLAFIAQKLFG